MKSTLFLLCALLTFPAIARADLVYKCKSIKPGTDYTADLRFTENGDGGSVDVEHWENYPPTSLLSAELKSPVSRNGKTIFESEIDPHFGFYGELTLPFNFLRFDFFQAEVVLLRSGENRPLTFTCHRF